MASQGQKSLAARLLWFVALWGAGVLSVAAVAWMIRLAIAVV
jgi:hypothetical protein